MDYTEFIKPELSALIPALYVLGNMIKNTEKIKDNYIPVILGGVGLVLSCLYVFLTEGVTPSGVITAVTQGILCAAVTVYSNQLYKQSASS